MNINNKHLFELCVFVMVYSLFVAMIKYSTKKNDLADRRFILAYGSQVRHGGEDVTTGREGREGGRGGRNTVLALPVHPQVRQEEREREEPVQSQPPVMYCIRTPPP